MNVGNPDDAFALSLIPNDGVGLAREEFIISNYIKIHPHGAARLRAPRRRTVKAEIDRLTAGYADKPGFFVDKLAQGVAMIAAAFYPKDVIVRMSDFKSNEYANLVGGRAYEPVEENPMIGFRGASRYYDPRYQAGFALECRAMKKVRDEMGLTNVKLMIPFCRTVEEGRAVAAEMAKHGLERGEERARALRDVRDPEQRDPGEAICADLRRLLDRVERSHAAHARRRPRLRDRRPHLRRAKRRGEDADRAGDRRGQGIRSQGRDLRASPERLPRVRAVPRRAGNRQHLAQPRCRHEDDRDDPRRREVFSR